MKNKIFWGYLLGVILFAGILFLVKDWIIPNGNSKNYNVIIIVSDALRYDILGCYGGKARTPNTDWIA